MKEETIVEGDDLEYEEQALSKVELSQQTSSNSDGLIRPSR